MNRLSWLAVAALASGCSGSGAAPAAPAPPAPHANLAQVMQAIPFPNSNIVFDTQTTDPAAKPAVDARRGGATADFSHVYGGWLAVENSALALTEAATLITLPGRLCRNGRPVPLDREDFRKFAGELSDAGLVAYKAAQSKSLDAMVEASGTVSDACAHCHEVYRDKDNEQDRCVA
jgi:cytochrome c556